MPTGAAGKPSVTTTSSLASVQSVYPVSDDLGDYSAASYPGHLGNNVFTSTTGSVTQTVTVPIDNTGATACAFNSLATGTKERRPASK